MSIAERHSLYAGMLSVGLATIAGAVIGLPLYGDGAFYFVEILLTGEPLIPNGRYSALLPQLPLLAAMALTEKVTLLRHAFSLGYAALPFMSLLACGLVVRETAPWLLLYPALFLVANQINFSAISELLMGLYLAWPLLLLAAVRPGARTTLVFGWMLAPFLLLLHPMAFALQILFGALGLCIAQSSGVNATQWYRLSAAYLGLGLCRLVWSVLGMNSYERSHLEVAPAVAYLMPETATQTALLGAVLVLGLLIATGNVRGVGHGARPTGGSWRRHADLSHYALWVSGGLIAVLGLLVAAEILAGEGIKLKSALVFPLALMLMALALLDASRSADSARTRPPAVLFLLLALTITMLSLAKTAVWMRATDDLADALATSTESCVPFGPEEPPALQYPHMTAVDNWTAPMTALVFQSGHPLVLLLPGDGCSTLAETGIAGLTSWYENPLGRLRQRFGSVSGAGLDP